MMSRTMAIVVALATAAQLRLASALSFDAEEAKVHPVSAVVKLLKDMKKELEAEADADEAVYEKLACWCETNDKGKTKAIADAVVRMKDLDATIQKMAALSQTLQVEIKALNKEIAEDQESLEKATAMREKAQGEFLGSEKEMIASIRSLNQAITVLSGHQGKKAAFLSNSVVVNAYSIARGLMDKHYDVLAGVITPSERKVLASFVQAPKKDYFDAEPTFNQAYAPQSGSIFGILSQMKETFENNLSQEQKEEMAAQVAYKDLKKAKEAEIQAGQDSVEAKSQQLAKADETLAQSKEDLEDTSASWSADKKFLMELKVKCKMTDKEWEERQKIRQSELQAVAKAIEILSSDEARDQFTKTLAQDAASFVQTRKENRRARAIAVISKVASKNPKLAALATAVRLDPFPKVKKAIDDMVAQLLKEKEDEIKEKAFCTDELNKNTRADAEKSHTKKKLGEKIDSLKQTISDQQDAIDTLDAEMKDLKAQRVKASKDRVAENQEYKNEVAEQQKTQKLLNSALKALKDVYGDGVALVQVQQAPAVGSAPPKDFNSYEKSRASSGIIAMIEQIVTDSQLMIKEARHNEQLSQDSFTKFKQVTNEALKAKDDAKVDLTSQKAQAEKDLTAAKSEFKGTITELEALAKSAGDLHKQCDFLLANFEITQKARDEEVESLRGAKAFLNGMQKD